EIEVAVFAFDGDHRLELVNRAGERLLGEPGERLLGHTAVDLGLGECLEGEPVRILQKAFPGSSASGGQGVGTSGSFRWGLHRRRRVIASRSEALSRFMGAYARLAKLPRPRVHPLEVGAWVRRVVGLETRMNVAVAPGPDLLIQADGDQLDQLLINVLRNAVD